MMEEMEKVAAKLREQGKKPYIIPGGASNCIGALGYVNCAQETMQQLFDMGLKIDHIVVPSGSAGTHAGMIAGMVGNNVDIPVSGVDVSRPRDVQEGIVRKLAQETLDYIGAGVKLPGSPSPALTPIISPATPCPTTAWWKRSNCSPAPRQFCLTRCIPARPCPA